MSEYLNSKINWIDNKAMTNEEYFDLHYKADPIDRDSQIQEYIYKTRKKFFEIQCEFSKLQTDNILISRELNLSNHHLKKETEKNKALEQEVKRLKKEIEDITKDYRRFELLDL